MSDRAYSRIYHELSDEYPEIFDGPDLAGYVRLLVAADQAWPSKARWGGYVDDLTMARLVKSGLVIPVGDVRYTIKGLDKERQTRWAKASKAGQASAAARSTTSSTTSSTRVRDVPQPRRDETSREETSSPARETDPVVVYHDCTLSAPKGGALEWINRLADAHGDAAVSDAMRREWMDDNERKTFIGRVETRLLSEARQRSREAEAARQKAEAEYQRRERERIESMPEEQRAANLAKLKAAISGIGS